MQDIFSINKVELFKYKAIDELIKQEPKTKVFYTGALKSDMETQSAMI